MIKYINWFFLLISFAAISQDPEDKVETREVTATVINAQTDEPLESVHVINLNEVIGTITNAEGRFTIRAAVNDTLYLSYLGFKTQK